LNRRRTLDEEQSQTWDSAAYRDSSSQGNDAAKLGGRDVQQSVAFRSCWTSTPSFHDWEKPKLNKACTEDKLRSDIDCSVPGFQSKRKLFDKQTSGKDDPSPNKASADLSLEKTGQIADACYENPSNSKSNLIAQQEQQKQRLDKLLEFASAENERLERLIEEAQSDGDTQTEQLGKLLQSKASTEKILSESKRQRDTLEVALKTAEDERDAARAENVQLVEERERLEGLVANTREENLRLESVVVEVQREKAQLEAIANQKAVLEQQLADVNAAASELAEKAKQSERLERIVQMGQTEQERLERLLSERTDEQTAVLRQKEALDAKMNEVILQNEQLQNELKYREKVEQAKQILEEENTRLRDLAEEAEVEKERLEHVLVETSEHNQQLQRDLKEAVSKHTELEHRTMQLEEERGGLQEQLHMATTQRDEALVEAEAARKAKENLEVAHQESEAAKQAAQLSVAKQVQQFEEHVHALEREKETLMQELKQAKSHVDNSEEHVLAVTREKEALQQQLNQATVAADQSKLNAASVEHERDALCQQLESAKAQAALAEEKLKHVEGEMVKVQQELEQRHQNANGLDIDVNVPMEAQQQRKNVHLQDEGSQHLKGIELQKEAGAMDAKHLAKQLEDVMRQNEELQLKINEELVKQSTAPEVLVDPATTQDPVGQIEPAEPTDFGLMLDNWLSALEGAQAMDPLEEETGSLKATDASFSGWFSSFITGGR